MSSTKKADHDGDSAVSFYETEDERKAQKEKKGGCVGCLRDNIFVIFILLGVVVGFGVGFGVRELKPSAEAIVWIAMPGNIFIRLLELTILPLIASNLIVVISQLDPKEQGLGSVLTVAYILGFNFAGAAIGTAMAALIKPGVGVNMTTSSTEIQDPGLTLTTSDVFSDLLLNMFPNNIVGMCLYQTKTEYFWKYPNKTERYSEKVNEYSTDLIGVLLTCIAFGLAARKAGEAGKPFLDFFQSLSEVVLKLVRVFLQCTPVGVAFMIAAAILNVSDIASAFAALGMFVLTVTAGIGVLFFLCLIVYGAVALRNPFGFLRNIAKAWFISFATTSPIVSLPEMFEGCDQYGVDQSISRFSCPLMTALKADGPAVFISSAAVFVAQTETELPSAGTLVVIWLLTSVSALAIPQIPSASIIITMTILSSAGVSTANTAYLYAVDWLLDRFRAGAATIYTMYGVSVVDSIAKRRKKSQEKIETISKRSYSFA
nr:unnamed protein product [Spirometra erinaceieuropaei]